MIAGAGVGLRPEITADLLARPGAADFLEVTAEGCYASPGAAREAKALARAFPVVVHGVKLSLGGAEGVDEGRARKLGRLARELRAEAVSEHVAFVRGGGREIGHLTGVPFTEEAVRVVARNVARARRALPDVPLWLENVAWTFRYPDDAIDEGDFHARVAESTGCDLLLDLGNVLADALNSGRDPKELVRRYPLDRVAALHVAGGVTEGGFHFDTHAHPLSAGVLDLLPVVLAVTGPIPIILERDADFPAFGELAAEIEALRRAGEVEARGGGREAREAATLAAERNYAGLAREQAGLAAMLTQLAEPTAHDSAPYGSEAIARSRQILLRKRIDDALPLLPRLSRHPVTMRAIGRAQVSSWERAPRLAAIADAFRLAAEAEGDPHLAEDARADLLLLRSRFAGSGHDGSLAPRLGPFVGSARLAGGRVLWAVKAPGTGAGVRLFESGRRA